MFQLHAFMVINPLIDNSIGKVSVLGELSPESHSYSREVGIYAHEDYSDIRLMTFHSVNDGIKEALESDLAHQILGLGHWLSQESLSNRIDDDRSLFLQKVSAEFLGKVTILQVGKMVTDGKYWLPEYITFQLTSDSRPNRYKVWFADEAFRHQYDKYEIEVIPPIVNVDDFHKSVGKVRQTLTDHNVSELHARVNIIADKHPYTYIISNMYDYVNPLDNKEKLPTSWTVIVYGEAGRNNDVIRDAIADYVLDNSDYARAEWEKLIPDLFVPTEFYLSPMWTQYATENLQLKGGIYSPVVPYRKVIPWALRTMYGYSEEHLINKTVVFNSIFKSIAVVACGHAKNRVTFPEFEKAWPEYCNIYTTSRDFNRIGPETQEFILFMNKMFFEAETLTPDAEIPQGMTRVMRGDLFYLTSQFNTATYLVPLRYNFLNEISDEHASGIHLPTNVGEGALTNDVNTRIRDVIDLTPSLGDRPNNTRRGRNTIDITSGVGNNGQVNDTVTTTIGKENPNGLEGTKVDVTDGTSAAINTATTIQPES